MTDEGAEDRPNSPPRPRLWHRLLFHRRRFETLARTSLTVLRTQGATQLARFGLRWLRRQTRRATPPPGLPSPAAPALSRPVAVIIPTYRQTTLVADCVASLHASLDTASRSLVRVVVVDDGSQPETQAALQKLPVQAVLRRANGGFSKTANDGLATLRPGEDAVVLNNDTLAHAGWLEALQAAAYRSSDIGVVGPRLLYPDGRIQSAGTYRSSGATSDWFDHCFRFMPGDHPPANIEREVLAVTGACMYIKHCVLESIGTFDPRFPMAFEDVDYCLRARDAGYRVLYTPRAVLTHLEGHTRGERRERREIDAQRLFWEKWGQHFDDRRVWRDSPDRLRVVYVLQDTGVAGGHRVIFEQMNRLAARGHDVELFSLAERPRWFPLHVPVRTFKSLDLLGETLSEEHAIKIATWWETGEQVWRASLRTGIPVFLAQDVETSYYDGEGAGAAEQHARVLASYRKEFSYLTDATWTRGQLEALGLKARVVAPGIDTATYRTADVPREKNVVLSLGRSHPLKNFALLRAALTHLQEGVALWLFGTEPRVGCELGARYVYCPSDEQVAGLYQRATVFVSTSLHEGFGLPILEAMACGCPVVCTDADGNMDFCRDGENCLIVPRHDGRAVARALERVIGDPSLQERLRRAGLATAARYTWSRATDDLEAFLKHLAEPGQPRF